MAKALPSLYLAEIHVRSIPGIETPYSVTGIQPGLNMILGPNGSGKTSLCRAVLATLWGDPKQRSEAVRAIWHSPDHSTVVEAVRNSGKTVWSENGILFDCPPPASYLSDCFIIRMEDLLPVSAGQGGIATQLGRELSGGYDLSAASAKFQLNNPRLQSLKAAQEALNKKQQAVRELKQSESTRRSLQTRLDAAVARHNLRPNIDQALELKLLEDEFESLNLRLSQFPPVLSGLVPGDSSRLREIANEIERHRRALLSAQEKAEATHQHILDNRLAVPLSAERLEALKTRIASLQDATRSISAAISEEKSAAAKLAQLSAYLSDAENDISAVAPISLTAIRQAEDLLAGSLTAQAAEAGLKRALAIVEQQAKVVTAGDAALPEAQRLLHQWLSTPVSTAMVLRSRRMLALILLLATISAVTAIAVPRSPLSLISAVLTIAATLVCIVKIGAASPDERQEIERRYVALSVPPPAGWNTAEVEACAARISGQIVDTSIAERLIRAAEPLRAQLDAATDSMQQLEERRRELADQSGIDLDRLHLSAVQLIRAAGEQLESASTLAAKTGIRIALEAERDRMLDKLDTDIKALMLDANICDAAAAQAACSVLDKSNLDLLQDIEVLKRQTAEHKVAEESLDAAQKRMAEQLSQRGVTSVEQLSEYEILLPDYTETVSRLEATRRQIQSLNLKLQRFPELTNRTLADLERIQNEAQTAQDEAETLRAELAALDARVEQARQSREAEELQARVDTEVKTACRLREKALLAEAGLFMVHQAARAEELQAPGVVQKADILFRSFTNQAYRLAVNRSPDGARASVQAIDSDTGRHVELSHLSGGTRVQLLIALRLAFAETASELSAVLPPIFIDEALANSDPERFDAAAACFRRMAAEGRQVFYLSSEPEDLDRLLRGGGPVHCIRLEPARRQSSIDSDFGQLAIQPLTEVPRPEGLTSQEYAVALSVPAINPNASPDAIPLWYLLSDNLTLLYRLLIGSYRTVGRARVLDRSIAERLGVSVADQRLIDRRIQLAERFCSGWRIGRPDPLKRDTLIDLGVSAAFIDRACDAAEKVSWDPIKTLIAIKGLKGFRTDAAREIEAEMRLRDVIVEADPLNEAELTDYILRACPDSEIEEVQSVTAALWRAFHNGSEPQQTLF